MTRFALIPIPQSPIGTVETDPISGVGRIIMSREWYRFLGLLQGALGGSTDVFADLSEQTKPPESLIGDVLFLLASAVIDASGQAIAARSIADDLRQRVSDLESQQRGREEFPFDRLASLEMMMPGPVG